MQPYFQCMTFASSFYRLVNPEKLMGQSCKNQLWALNVNIYPRRQQWYHLFGHETHANRSITAQSWDYLMYLCDLAVHKDHLGLPHQRMTSQSALLL